MPTVYRIEFSDDAVQKGIDASLAGVVTFDGRKTGRIIPGEYQALLIGNEIKALQHPAEESTLRAHNQTYFSASFRGILLRVENRICLRCGNIFDAPRLTISVVAGCLPALLLSLLTCGFLRFGVGTDTGGSLLIAWTVLMAVPVLFQFAGTLYIRTHFAERQKSIRQSACPACNGIESVPVSRCSGKRVQIGSEGKWIQVSIAGRS